MKLDHLLLIASSWALRQVLAYDQPWTAPALQDHPPKLGGAARLEKRVVLSVNRYLKPPPSEEEQEKKKAADLARRVKSAQRSHELAALQSTKIGLKKDQIRARVHGRTVREHGKKFGTQDIQHTQAEAEALDRLHAKDKKADGRYASTLGYKTKLEQLQLNKEIEMRQKKPGGYGEVRPHQDSPGNSPPQVLRTPRNKPDPYQSKYTDQYQWKGTFSGDWKDRQALGQQPFLGKSRSMQALEVDSQPHAKASDPGPKETRHALKRPHSFSYQGEIPEDNRLSDKSMEKLSQFS